MIHEIRIPALGESIGEAVVAAWLRAEGDVVANGEPVLELETDKVSVQVAAPAAGRLAIRMAAGTTAQIGETVATVDDTATSPTRVGGDTALSPAVRRLVVEHGIDPSEAARGGRG